jgi:hypothetical protein
MTRKERLRILGIFSMIISATRAGMTTRAIDASRALAANKACNLGPQVMGN